MTVPTDGMVTPALVGTRLGTDVLDVTPELTTRYARAVNDVNSRYVGDAPPGDLMAPPMFGIVPAMRALRSAVADGTLPISMKRTVHGEQDMTFVSPIRPGDLLVSESVVRKVEAHSTGSTVDIETITTTRKGDERVRQGVTLFVRQVESAGTPRRLTPLRADPAYVSTMRVAHDQTFRYAKASFTEGIQPHEDHDFARSLGYRTYFLQGQCTMAFAAKAIVDNVAGGDPRRLGRLKVRFSQVVYPSEVLTTRIWPSNDAGKYLVETSKQNGDRVLVDGLAEVRT